MQGLNFGARCHNLCLKFTKPCWKESREQEIPAWIILGFLEIFAFMKQNCPFPKRNADFHIMHNTRQFLSVHSNFLLLFFWKFLLLWNKTPHFQKIADFHITHNARQFLWSVVISYCLSEVTVFPDFTRNWMQFDPKI